MKIEVFRGDITSASAEAICTSTNPRLSLMMGTGGAAVERGGRDVKRAAERLLEREQERTGRPDLAVGSVHPTLAGKLPYKVILHCVASDALHRSSVEIIQACVVRALAAAAEAGSSSIAMPVFATGHARFPFRQALEAMLDAIDRSSVTGIDQVLLVVSDAGQNAEAEAIVAGRAPRPSGAG